MATEEDLLKRITVCPDAFGGKPIVGNLRIAVEHIMGILPAGHTLETISHEYSLLEGEDIQACPIYSHRTMTGKRMYEPTEVR